MAGVSKGRGGICRFVVAPNRRREVGDLPPNAVPVRETDLPPGAGEDAGPLPISHTPFNAAGGGPSAGGGRSVVV